MKVYLNLDQLLTPQIHFLNLLTKNQYVIKGYFSTANKIRHTAKELFEEGYRFVLFDVDSKQDQTYTKGIV